MFRLPKPYKSCADALYNNNVLPQPSFPRDIFVELMQLATSSVEFGFNNNMYRQIDGVAMGSPLVSPWWAHFRRPPRRETLQLRQQAVSVLPVRRWHVRCIQQWRWLQCVSLASQLASPLLTLRPWKGIQSLPPFLDVLVERLGSEFSTSVYRKPTFTGQYLRWNSFSAHKRKINLNQDTHCAFSWGVAIL